MDLTNFFCFFFFMWSLNKCYLNWCFEWYPLCKLMYWLVVRVFHLMVINKLHTYKRLCWSMNGIRVKIVWFVLLALVMAQKSQRQQFHTSLNHHSWLDRLLSKNKWANLATYWIRAKLTWRDCNWLAVVWLMLHCCACVIPNLHSSGLFIVQLMWWMHQFQVLPSTVFVWLLHHWVEPSSVLHPFCAFSCLNYPSCSFSPSSLLTLFVA